MEGLHHAYLIQDRKSGDIWALLEQDHSFRSQANPDAWNIEAETFGIDEARALSDWSYKKSFSGIKAAVINANSITSEAQNALLKLFEEPPAGTYFFLIVSNTGVILPTLLSRMHMWESGEMLEKGKKDSKFLKSSLAERIKIISKIAKDKNKEEARQIIASILQSVKDEPMKYYKEIEELMKAQRFLAGRAPSLKMILEHIAVSI